MLTLQVKEKEVEITNKEDIIRGTVGVSCKVIFDEFWQGYNKTVVFKRTNECVSSYGIFVGGMETETTIPHEILRESGTFQIGVFGTTENSTLPTLWSDEISILYGTDTDTTFPEEPTPSIYEQLVELSTNAVEVANSVREDADNGEFNGEKGDKGDAGEVTLEYANNTFANALKGSKSGETVAITDLSPLEHKLSVKVSGVSDLSAVKVKKLGKNIIPFPYSSKLPSVEGVQIIVNENGTITYSGTPTKNNQYDLLKEPLVLKEDAFLSGCPEGGNSTNRYAIQAVCVDLTGALRYPTDIGNGAVINKGWTIERMFIQIRAGAELNSLVFAPQLEYGSSATAYEPYIEPIEYPVSADGTVDGVTPIYPTTTLMTDTAGAAIDCTYNRDINKAFAELQQAIISLGGNV